MTLLRCGLDLQADLPLPKRTLVKGLQGAGLEGERCSEEINVNEN